MIYLINFILAVNLTYALIRIPRIIASRCKYQVKIVTKAKAVVAIAEVGQKSSRPLVDRVLMTVAEEDESSEASSNDGPVTDKKLLRVQQEKVMRDTGASAVTVDVSERTNPNAVAP